MSLEQLSDEELAAESAKGDESAMTMLIDRHFDYVSTLCRRIIRDPQAAEDARQETHFKVAQRIKTFDRRSSYKTWLHAIAVNASLNQLRSDARAPVPATSVEQPASLKGHARFEHAVDARVDIDTALEQMTPIFRDAIVLGYLCDLDQNAIAEVLDISVGTVKSRLSRGMTELKKIFGIFPSVRGV